MSHYVVWALVWPASPSPINSQPRATRSTVVERDAVVGGLARILALRGLPLRVGPHRFHTDNPRVEAFIGRFSATTSSKSPRRSGVRMFGKFHEWPLRPGILLSMPFSADGRREHSTSSGASASTASRSKRTSSTSTGARFYSIFFERTRGSSTSPRRLNCNQTGAGRRQPSRHRQARERRQPLSLPQDTLLAEAGRDERSSIRPPASASPLRENWPRALRHPEERGARTPVTGIEADASRGRRPSPRRRADVACDGVVWTAPLTLVRLAARAAEA